MHVVFSDFPGQKYKTTFWIFLPLSRSRLNYFSDSIKSLSKCYFYTLSSEISFILPSRKSENLIIFFTQEKIVKTNCNFTFLYLYVFLQK